ncbi:MAG: transcriptional repressor [Nitrospirae bacterium]|nr:transcriptional repressor [Nitrospirota bacterium]
MNRQESISDKKEHLKSFIKTKGLKSTRQRDIIVTEFLKTEGHVTAEEFYRKINRRHKNIGFTTVYRTLKLLAESGLAAEQVFADNLTRYESLLGEEHHDHLICQKCGSITEFKDNKLENMQVKIADELGFQILNHKMEFYGYCSNCRK